MGLHSRRMLQGPHSLAVSVRDLLLLLSLFANAVLVWERRERPQCARVYCADAKLRGCDDPRQRQHVQHTLRAQIASNEADD